MTDENLGAVTDASKQTQEAAEAGVPANAEGSVSSGTAAKPGATRPVDQHTQADAAEERAKQGGYD